MKQVIKDKFEKSGHGQPLIHFHEAVFDTILRTGIGFVLAILLLTFLNPILRRKRAEVHQSLQAEDFQLEQDKMLMFTPGSSSRQEIQSENTETPTYDLASSSAAHTAQLTLISILLGAIVGALFVGLPPGFVSKLWNGDYLDLDFRVLATFLAAIDLWVKYSWGIIVVRWPFSILHNLTYSLVSGAMIGFAMSVADLNAWLAWGSATCFASFIAYMVNMYATFRETHHRKMHSHKPIISEDPPYSAKELEILRDSSLGEAFLILLPGIPALYAALNNYHLLPAWLQWPVSFSLGMGWGGYITLFVIIDILIQGLVVMPKQRYGRTTSSTHLYHYNGERR